MNKKIIAFDTETYLMKPYEMAPPIICLSFTYDNTTEVIKDNIYDWLKAHLTLAADNQFLLVGHNVAYDMSCILATYPKLTDLVFAAYESDGVACTIIREKLLDIAQDSFRKIVDKHGNNKKKSYSLESLMNLNKQDSWRLRYSELAGIPLEQWPKDAIDYSKTDALSTLRLFEKQQKRATQIDYTIPTQYEDTKADLALRLMSVWGIETDKKYVTKRWNEIASQMNELALELSKEKIMTYSKGQLDLFVTDKEPLPVTTKSNATIRKLVHKSYPGNPPLTPKGFISTDEDTIKLCSDPLLTKLLEFKKLEKEISTYISKYFEPIIHGGFQAIGAESDRTSCREPNLQNQPRKEGSRECFIPRKNHIFMACDFDSQEMRTLAQSCLDLLNQSRLADMYQKDPNFDPHLEFAKLLDPKNPQGMRQHAKVCNFGFPGGLGPSNFVVYARNKADIIITENQAKHYKQHWLQQWPEMRLYFKHIESLVGSAKYGTQIIPISGFRRLGVGFNDAANGYFQTRAAHASKLAAWEVCKKCYLEKTSPLYDSRPILFVHDEVILETDLNNIKDKALELSSTMVKAMELLVPDIPVRAEVSIMKRWSKKQNTTIFKKGKLVSYEINNV